MLKTEEVLISSLIETVSFQYSRFVKYFPEVAAFPWEEESSLDCDECGPFNSENSFVMYTLVIRTLKAFLTGTEG